jgi:hypothetical protein
MAGQEKILYFTLLPKAALTLDVADCLVESATTERVRQRCVQSLGYVQSEIYDMTSDI